jgi:hypothetical protein
LINKHFTRSTDHVYDQVLNSTAPLIILSLPFR